MDHETALVIAEKAASTLLPGHLEIIGASRITGEDAVGLVMEQKETLKLRFSEAEIEKILETARARHAHPRWIVSFLYYDEDTKFNNTKIVNISVDETTGEASLQGAAKRVGSRKGGAEKQKRG